MIRRMPMTDQFDEILQANPSGACVVTLSVQRSDTIDAPRVARYELLRRGLRPELRPAGVLHLTVEPNQRVMAEGAMRALDSERIRGELVDVTERRPQVAYAAPSTLQGQLAKTKAETGSPWGTACAGGTQTTEEDA